LINELALIFDRLNIDTEEVLQAAGTKWNFLPFRPGLVGGHCIGVDPYYLTHKAQEVGYHPEMILAGRRLNDNMAGYVAERVAQLMGRKSLLVNRARVLVMGLAFKENCPDVRNSKVVDLIRAMEKFGAKVDAWDPWVDPRIVKHEYGITPIKTPRARAYDAVVVAVAHDQFKTLGLKGVKKFLKKKHVLFDIKHVFKAKDVDGRL
jgi:UDP-N-acetyl-D-galactosamine dehydrogenase